MKGRLIWIFLLGAASAPACSESVSRRPRIFGKTAPETGPTTSADQPTPPSPVVIPAPSGDALSAIHAPKPESCTGCHEQDRQNATHYPGKDCATCHTFPSFKGAFFAHAPKPTVCEECHARPQLVGQRAYPNQGPPANFNPADVKEPGSGHYRGKDCVTCHATPAENATQFVFSHAAPAAPQACLPCHFTDGNGEHRNDGRAELVGFGNCFNCHQNFNRNVERNWDRN